MKNLSKNNLRIGNIVAIKEDISIYYKTPCDAAFTIEYITAEGLIGIDSEAADRNFKNVPVEHLVGMRLNPEILSNWGFVLNDTSTEYRMPLPYGNGSDMVLEDMCSDFQLPIDVMVSTEKSFAYIKPVTYVHEIQNLFFALTGNELGLDA